MADLAPIEVNLADVRTCHEQTGLIIISSQPLSCPQSCTVKNLGFKFLVACRKVHLFYTAPRKMKISCMHKKCIPAIHYILQGMADILDLIKTISVVSTILFQISSSFQVQKARVKINEVWYPFYQHFLQAMTSFKMNIFFLLVPLQKMVNSQVGKDQIGVGLDTE